MLYYFTKQSKKKNLVNNNFLFPNLYLFYQQYHSLMQLEKLRTHTIKISKNRTKLKCLSLGVILPPIQSLRLSQQQISQKLINLDSCIHKQNSNQVLIGQFKHQLPNDDDQNSTNVNKLYENFIFCIKGMNRVEQGAQQSAEDMRTSRYNSSIEKSKMWKNKDNMALIACQIIRIYQEADKKHQIKRYKKSKIQKQIQKLYVQSHEHYLQLMRIKSSIEAQISAQLEASKIYIQKQQPQTKNNTNQKQQPTTNNNTNNKPQSQKNKQQQNNDSDIDIIIQHTTPRQKQKQKQNEEAKKISRRRTITNSTIQSLNIAYQKMNDKISKLKQTINKTQEQCLKLSNQQILLREEKSKFLKLLLKNGYHLSDGIWWMLVKLAQNKQKLQMKDLCEILDIKTKQMVIEEYDNILKHLAKNNKEASLPKLKLGVKQKEKDKRQTKYRYQNSSQMRLQSLNKYDNSLKIYKEAKNYIADWVRKQKWRSRSLKAKQVQQIDLRKDQINSEIKRIKSTCSPQKFQQIMLYIFGSTKYYHRPTHDKIQQFVSTRRHKDSLNSLTPQLIRTSSKQIKSVQFLSRNNTNK